MFDSRVKTLVVPVITAPTATGGVAPSPAVLIKSTPHNCVVKVRNISFAQSVYLAFSEAVLATFPPSGEAYELPPGTVDTFVIAKHQDFYVAAVSGPAEGEGPTVAVHIYQDVPTTGAGAD